MTESADTRRRAAEDVVDYLFGDGNTRVLLVRTPAPSPASLEERARPESPEEELRRLLDEHFAPPPLEQTVREARALRHRDVELTWHDCWGGRWCADFGADSLRVRRAAEGEGSELSYHWSYGGSRRLGRGSVDELKARAREILAAGGPHGGPADEPGSKRRRTLSFTRHPLGHGIEVAGLGAGFQSWLRPVTSNSVCSVLVSPSGDFVIHGFDRPSNAPLRADHQIRNVDPWGDTIGGECRPFHVKVRGVPHRLVHTSIRGALGAAETCAGEVLLTITGPGEVALWRVDPDGSATELIRDTPAVVNGYEMEPHAVPIRKVPRPRASTVDAIAESIDTMTSIAAPVRRELIERVRALRKEAGSRTLRTLLWALCAAHEAGRRDMVTRDAEDLLRELLCDHAEGVPEVPCERARGQAIALLESHFKFVHRPKPRSPRLCVHWEWLSQPPVEFLAALGLGP